MIDSWNKRRPVCLNGNSAHTHPNYQLHQMAIFTAFTTPNTYRLRGRMVGHVDAIHSLAVTSSGRLLASGGLLLSCMTIHTSANLYTRIRRCQALGLEYSGATQFSAANTWNARAC
jgi:hypothetical protein